MRRAIILSTLAALAATGIYAQPQFEDTPEQKAAKEALAKANKEAKAARASEENPYGFRLGTIGGFAGFGIGYNTTEVGVHPVATGGLEIGLQKYLGIFAQGGWSRDSATATECYGHYCAAAVARANDLLFGAGVEVVGTNHSRVVPYGRFGVGYLDVRVTYGAADSFGNVASGAMGVGDPALMWGGGAKVYLNHHFGIDGGVTIVHPVGHNLVGMSVAPTVGVFFQSK